MGLQSGVGHVALVSYKAASDILGKAAFFVVLLAAARVLPTPAFGVFSLASTLGWILSVGTDFGLQLHLAREVARAPNRLRAILAPMLRLRLWLAAWAIGLTIPLAFVWVPVANAMAFIIIVSAYVAGALVEFLNYVYRAVSRSELESTINLAQRLATLVTALAVLAWAPSLNALAVALVLPPATAFAFSAALSRRLARAARPAATGDAARTLSRAVFLRDVFPIGAGILLSALYFRIDLFLVQHWRGLEDVARYNAVFRLVEALRLFPAAVLAVLLPIVFQRRDRAFVWRMSGGLTAFGVAVAGVLSFAAPLVIALTYGAKYAGAVPAFRILLLSFPLLCLNYGLTHQVIGWGQQRAYAAICAMALAINFALNAVFIPQFGIAGAAWATLGTEVVITLGAVSSLMRASAPA